MCTGMNGSHHAIYGLENAIDSLGRSDKLLAFLLLEGLLTNVGGLLTLISSIPNIIVGKAAEITYLKFLIVAGPYTIVAVAASVSIRATTLKHPHC